MEKIDASKFPKYDGDFIKLPSTFRILGIKNISYLDKKGKPTNTSIMVVKREDGVELQLFSDQLRIEGETLFVSDAHLQAQIARQEAYQAQRGKPK